MISSSNFKKLGFESTKKKQTNKQTISDSNPKNSAQENGTFPPNGKA